MSRIEVRDFASADLAPAAQLLSDRFARAGAPSSGSDFAPHDASSCRKVLERLASEKYARGAIASAAGAPIGFLFAQPNLTAPDSALSYFSPAFSVGSPLSGHAVAAGHELLGDLGHDLARGCDVGSEVRAEDQEVHARPVSPMATAARYPAARSRCA